VAISRLSNTLR